MIQLNLKSPLLVIVVAMVLSAFSAIAEQEFFTPEQDRDGLKKNIETRAQLPNVLIIGDSISIGYTLPVVTRLKNVANVQRVSVNCGDTNFGRKNLTKWLGDTHWDMIHFNWGLHDLCYHNPESKERGNRDKAKGVIAVPLVEYEKNLESIVLQLEKTGASLVWASTTRVPEDEPGRFVGDALVYNAAAEKIMKRHGIVTDDLYALTVGFDSSLAAGVGDVHYTKQGYGKIAEQVAKLIQAVFKEGHAIPVRSPMDARQERK